ncbi:MAG: malonyl-CoA synthase [Betaproteobacteria bacterium]|jgi:malonyl-CoA/methylmalonyl-CoA synthetase|nr:malonyl-CoA synthase [Betaproteobacteria bacterium]
MSNLYRVLESQFPRTPDRCAFETPDGRYYTFDDLRAGSAKIANWLVSLGIARGSRIAVQVEKSVEAVMLYLAALRSGMVFLPLNTAYRESEIGYFISDAEPAVVVCSPANFSWVEPIARANGCSHVMTLGEAADGSLIQAATPHRASFKTVSSNPDDLAAILYTSGTTGRSKGAMLSHRNLSSNARTLQKAWHWQRGDVLIHALPIFHVHGLFVALHGALINGSKTLWCAKFDADQIIRLLPRATVMMGVPTFYVRLAADDRLTRAVVKGVRLFISGSAPLLKETFEAFRAKTGHVILERYGMSETVMLTSNPYKGERRAGTVGFPLPGVGLRLVDDRGRTVRRRRQGLSEIGAVQVRGPNVFSGYWRMPEKTREEFTQDRWFRTGDMGQWDADGYLHLIGRSKDLIITGGYNVYPKEIEMLIDEMAGVDESAVIGIPHPDFGEAVTAVVVAKPGASLNPQSMIAEIKARIANFKVPKAIHIVQTLPRNAMGKVQKNILREQFS